MIPCIVPVVRDQIGSGKRQDEDQLYHTDPGPRLYGAGSNIKRGPAGMA